MNSLTDFNKFADTYGETENNLLRRYVEKPTFLSVLKDVQDKSVLDLACGEGNYTRTIKRYGASYVMGTDISEKMIVRAMQIEKEQSLGIDYRAQDARAHELMTSFDIVTAIYLFPHAQTEQALTNMAQATYLNLKPNGRLVAIINNPEVTDKHLRSSERYGICMQMKYVRDMAPILVTYPDLSGGPIHITNYYWSRETYERVLKKVGFRKIVWHPMLVSEEGVMKYGFNYWEEYLATPHITVLECHK